MRHRTLRLNLFSQTAAKLALFAAATALCAGIFQLPETAFGRGGGPAVWLAECLTFSFALSLVQVVFLTDAIIRSMAFPLRCALTALLSAGLAAGLGAAFGWFVPSLALAAFFLPIFTAVFTLSLLLIERVQRRGLPGLSGVVRAAPERLRRTAGALLTAFMIGFASGYRGRNELERPWASPDAAVTEINRTSGGPEDEGP